MSQFLLDGTLHTDFRVARAFRRLKDAVSRVHDGVVRYRLNGRTLALRLSHDLPWNRRVHPTYSENLRRLAGWVRAREGALRMIDVGANVGDSWALAASDPGDRFLLIEGNPGYFGLLERNTAGQPGVTRELVLLSDRAGDAAGTIVVEQGNARLVAGGDSRRLSFDTLDAVLERHQEFRRSNLLKVDVEGWDPRVLRGARRLLGEARPVLLFEHQPREVLALGEPAGRVFGDIGALGYRRWILYDHRGWLVGAVGPDEDTRLEALLEEAAGRDGYYYDVCAFHDSAAAAREGFLAAEQEHFAGLMRGSQTA